MRAQALLACACLGIAPMARGELYYLIVAGLGGEPRYEERFLEQSTALADAARRTLGGDATISVLTGEEATRAALKARLEELAEATQPSDRLAVFLVGHGSYDGERYKLNLPGPDIDDEELAGLLAAVPARSQLIVNATSASGAVLESWAGEGRTLITATRSGAERNATRFAEYWALSLFSDEADANKNGVITAQEAFDYASRRVADSFESEGALATEHPQLVGADAARFDVARLAAPAASTPELERLAAEREALEEEIEGLRLRREDMPSDAYLDQLQELLLQLALVQRQIDGAGESQ